jgi:uncharacterized protein (DUF1015 family)
LAEITQFPGIRFNQQIIKNMEDVICPPYDIITPEEQKAYYNRSEYNIIRLEHGLINPDDNNTNNKYTRARDTLNGWLNDHILKTDNDLTFYIYEQGFKYRDGFKKRLGLIACVRLESWANKVIFPHENTMMGVKSDRLDLMRATNSNISPVLSLYDDPGHKVTKLMTEKMLPGRLLININNGVESHRMWKANEPEFTQRVSHFMLPKSIYIADGHHRYETALAYRDEKAKSSAGSRGNEAYNYIMMTLVSFSDSGIVMLPVHRVIKNIPTSLIEELKNFLPEFFEISKHPLTEAQLSETRGNDIRALGLEDNKIWTLKLHPTRSITDVLTEHHSLIYQRLDISICEHIIMETMLSPVNSNENIIYTPDASAAWQMIKSGEAKLAFLLNTLPVTTLKSIADNNDRMPRKSTYFYPKLPTGLVINRLDGIL